MGRVEASFLQRLNPRSFSKPHLHSSNKAISLHGGSNQTPDPSATTTADPHLPSQDRVRQIWILLKLRQLHQTTQQTQTPNHLLHHLLSSPTASRSHSLECLAHRHGDAHTQAAPPAPSLPGAAISASTSTGTLSTFSAGWKAVHNQGLALSPIPAAAGAAPRVVAVSPARRTALATRRSTTQV